MKSFVVASTKGADYFSTPVSKATGHLSYLSSVPVSDWTAIKGDVTFVPFTKSGAVSYIPKSALVSLSHLERASKASDFVYKKVYDLKALHESAGKVVSLETLEQYKRISCGRSASIVLQLAGVLPVGKCISHTTSDGKKGATKTTKEKAITGLSNLIEGTYTLKRVNCLYKDLPAECKEKGVVCIQDSNVFTMAGNNKAYSCNQTGKHYGEGGQAVLKSSGYTQTTPILYCIIPKKD